MASVCAVLWVKLKLLKERIDKLEMKNKQDTSLN